MQINMHEAKSQLSKLGERVWKGERVIIAKAGKPFIELIPHRESTTPRRPGQYKDQIQIADNFDDVDQGLIDAFEGES